MGLPAPAVAELGGTEPRRGWQQGYPGGHEPCGPAQRGHAEHRPLHRRAAVLLLEPRVGSAGGVLKAQRLPPFPPPPPRILATPARAPLRDGCLPFFLSIISPTKCSLASDTLLPGRNPGQHQPL